VNRLLYSVVIPAVKINGYLDVAVESALDDVGGLGEVIVVIDGPMRPIEAAWASDDRLTVVATGRHLGTPRALNLGLRTARADFVVRLDADDVAVKGRSCQLQRQLAMHEDCVAVGSWAELIDDRDVAVGVLEMPESPVQVRAQLIRRNALIHSSVMYRRQAVLAIGGYNESCPRMQDYELFLRLAMVGSLCNLPIPLVRYRMHPDQASRCSSPYRLYTREVLRARMALARKSGWSWYAAALNNALWWVGQVARHHGLRQARYVHS